MKKVLGLILELNPLHNGHKYFIEKAIKEQNPDTVIAITSTNFTMRGEVSVINKFEKTQFLLDLGIDIVLELPFLAAVCSADYFAYNTVMALNKFGVTDIVCGSELNDIDKLMYLDSLTNSQNFNDLVKEYLDKGYSYNTCCNKALSELTTDEDLIINYSLPNNTLALQYLKAIKRINKSINLSLIKRINNNYYDEGITGEISSASSIRNLIKRNEDISSFVPFNYDLIDINICNNNLFNLIKYKFINLETISNYLGVKEGIENRVFNQLDKSNTLDELIQNSQTKRYSANYIKRLLLHIIMETSNQTNQEIEYTRILGFNKKAKKYINGLSKDIKETIITSPKNTNNIYCLNELRATKLYEILTNKKIYNEEFKIPIIKEG